MLLIKAVSERQLGYYFRDPADSGVFGGIGSKMLGLSGVSVEQRTLRDLAWGIDPQSGLSLGPRRRVRHAAFDCVFPAPKSVSLLFALGEAPTAEAVVAAHEAAREAALAYLERTASWVRLNVDGRQSLEKAHGVLWASFLHRTSRSGDPHLHSHVLILNLVPSDQRGWSPFQAGPLFAERWIGARIYENDLRYELVHRLGHSFRTRSGPASDVAGFSDRVVDAFSLRSVALRGDPRTPKPPKIPDPVQEVLTTRWRERAASLGVVDRGGPLVPGVLSSRRTVREAAESLIASFDRPFRRGDVLVRLLRSGALTSPGSEIERILDGVLAERTEHFNESQPRAFDSPALRRDWDPRVTERYVTQEVARLLDKEAALIATAVPFTTALGRDHAAKVLETSNLVAASTSAHPMAVYGALRSLGERLQGSGITARALSATVRALSDFEAMTGLVGEAAAPPSRRIEADVVVLVDPARLSLARRVELIERQLERGGRVVVLDAWRHDGAEEADTESLRSAMAAGAAETRWLRVGDTPVGFADSLRGALATIDARVRELGPAARAVVPRRLSAWVEATNVSASGVGAGSMAGLGPFVVLGGRRSLVRPPAQASFEHVVVEPVGLRANERDAAARAVLARARWSPGIARFSSEEWRAAGWIALSNDASVDRSRDGLDRERVEVIGRTRD